MVDLASLKVSFIAGCLGQGGAERQLVYILQALQSLDVRVRVLSLTKGEYWEEKIRQLGIHVTWVGRRGSRLVRLARIVAIVRKEKPHVIQSQHFYTNLYAVGAARLLRIREIGAIRNDATSEVRINGPVWGPLSMRAPRVLAANSRQAVENAVKLGVAASRLRLLPNVVDVHKFQPSCAPESDHHCVRILNVGRLVEQKRIDVFLETLTWLRQRVPQRIRATIVGDGPQRADLEQRARELGLSPGVVEFRGCASDMAAVYRQADLLMLTSDWEGTPNVLLEAMACGLPVVATRVGGVPGIVRDGSTGYLVEPEDVGMLVDRASRLCHDPSLRSALGQSGRQYILANHSPRVLPRFLRELYEAAL